MKDWQFYVAILLLVVLLLPIYEGLTEKEIEKNNKEINRIADKRYNLPPYEITKMTLEQIHKMTPKEINDLSESHFRALLKRIANLNDKLTPAQISELSKSKLKIMSKI